MSPRDCDGPLRRKEFRFATGRAGTPEGRFLLFDSRDGMCGPPATGQTVIDVDLLRGESGEDPLAAMVDERSARFQWHVAGMTLVEEIARVDKRAIRRQVLDRLRARIESAGGIWLRLAAYPFPYRSAFNFRIDHDHYVAADFDSLMNAIAGWEHATSHYVNGSTHESAGEVWTRLRGLDVGSHGYWNHTYREEEDNLRNLRRGIEVIQAAGIEPQGFAAPHGRFNRGLASAMASLDVSHGGEFALAHDELPFHPIAGGTLQIPVHPVGLGLFLNAAGRGETRIEAAVRAAGDYFVELAQARYRQAEPLFFYGQSNGRLGRHPEVLRRLFETVAGFAAVWKTTRSQFADWWRARSSARLNVTRQGSQFMISIETAEPGWRYGVEFCRDKHVALMPLDDSAVYFSPDTLAYENRGERPMVRPVRIDRPEGIQAHFRRMIDWERVTPIDEIPSVGWRNAAKRTLRRWWKP